MPSAVPLSQLREWVAASAKLARWRGTSKGLEMLLETVTGMTGFEIVEGVDAQGATRPFHFFVIAPFAAEPQRRFLERLIQLEKPAYATCDPIVFGRPHVA